MKKHLFALLLVLTFAFFASAQKLPKPKKMPVPATAEQTKLIQQGIAFHDAKKFDEAIAKYQEVLSLNPDSTLAMYEMALSLYDKGDKTKSKEIAFRGANYIADELPLFYGMIANALDDEGKPKEAIKIYRDAEDIVASMPDMKRHLSSINYNLAITYFRLKKFTESRAEAKKAVEASFSYASPHYLLAVVYNGTKYKVPALLAATRLISIELSSQRTVMSADIITQILKPQKDEKAGDINIFMNIDAPKDEGDFTMFDLILGTVTTVRGDDDKGKSNNQMFVEGLGSVFAILDEDKKLKSTFVGRTYIPFVAEMKKLGHLEAFGNLVLYLSDKQNDEARRWIDSNEAKVNAFVSWAKAYKLSGMQ